MNGPKLTFELSIDTDDYHLPNGDEMSEYLTNLDYQRPTEKEFYYVKSQKESLRTLQTKFDELEQQHNELISKQKITKEACQKNTFDITRCVQKLIHKENYSISTNSVPKKTYLEVANNYNVLRSQSDPHKTEKMYDTEFPGLASKNSSKLNLFSNVITPGNRSSSRSLSNSPSNASLVSLDKSVVQIPSRSSPNQTWKCKRCFDINDVSKPICECGCLKPK